MKVQKKTIKIKVIKKKDIGVEKTPVLKKHDSPEVTARNMAVTISTWIEDLQKRRFQEAKSAVEAIYDSRPLNA